MKIIFSAIYIAFITLTVSCCTTTYINLKESNDYYIKRQLADSEKDEDFGSEVTIMLKDGNKINGELLAASDSTVIVCEKYSASEKELIEQIYPLTISRNNEIHELTVEGHSYVWLGVIGGGNIGFLTGFFIGFRRQSCTRGTRFKSYGFCGNRWCGRFFSRRINWIRFINK